jgi:mono/diheme cytochrome c family protein
VIVNVLSMIAMIAALFGATIQERTVADGVYTDAQAGRGAVAYDVACSGCHRPDLSGGTGPALKEQRFARIYAGKDLKALYTKIATTMPRPTPASLADGVYLDIVAHVLKENGFKAGAHELTADGLEEIRVLPGQPKPPPPIGDYSYVEVVGCLTAGERGAWLLTNASEPVVVVSGASPASATAANDKPDTPLGTQTFHLLDAMAYPAAAHRGHKIYLRGLLIKLPDEQRLTISTFEMIAPGCGG